MSKLQQRRESEEEANDRGRGGVREKRWKRERLKKKGGKERMAKEGR